jgi:hypothetical protein
MPVAYITVIIAMFMGSRAFKVLIKNDNFINAAMQGVLCP